MLILAANPTSRQSLWFWCFAVVAVVVIGYEIRSRKTWFGGVTVSHADSLALIIIAKSLAAGLVFWLFYE